VNWWRVVCGDAAVMFTRDLEAVCQHCGEPLLSHEREELVQLDEAASDIPYKSETFFTAAGAMTVDYYDDGRVNVS
jgi:hypothetical protein